ncbi:sterol esterase from carbohydrate esterase family CE10 [Pyrrhoderma noxium]|uniref:Carboxylic ester hydrolase n=1 Tax=Pyrrhoderma noxium TaxID=2282107 RepID=A0A286UGL3_9AGAM|nr:sterol esterase from carbohydrate esterase family CE10 [Pyrrhoderma noxium]
MTLLLPFLLSALCFSSLISGTLASEAPTVTLDYGTFQGNVTGNLTYYLGMPYAQAPVGDLRFAAPQSPETLEGIQDATSYGPACPQSLTVLGNLSISGLFSNDTDTSEDCLSINVIKPSNIPDGTKLPVLFWMYGGAFQFGSSSENKGNTVVERSIALGEPVIHVSANYRLNAFGFLPGKEILDAGLANAGIRDQRFALEWVHNNIEKFGGDPSQVIIWGESAGSISVALQMTLNGGDSEGLFHGAIMESGSLFHTKLDMLEAQPFYDSIVNSTGCSNASDTLACLRTVSTKDILDAVDQLPGIFSYSAHSLTWSPRTDGELIKYDPVPTFDQGLYAHVPVIIGDCEDEGTLFSLVQRNITTNGEFLEYVKENYLPQISQEDLEAIGEAYPEDPSQGSPFDTGSSNAVTPQYKRLAAFTGDLIFQAPRRYFLQTVSKTQNAWAFLYKRGKSTPILGAYHGSDIPEFYGSSTSADFIGTDTIINFANTLSPVSPSNSISLLSSSGIKWDRWNSSADSPPLLTFSDPSPNVTITADTFRKDAIDLVNRVLVEIQEDC